MLPMPVLQTTLGTLYEGDCTVLLRKLPESSADLVFADPPFNLSKSYASGMDDDLPDAAYLAWCRKWLVELARILKPGGSLFLYNLPKWNIPLGAFLMESLTFRHWITVDMKYCLPIPKRLYPSNYSLLYFIKGSSPAIFHPDRLPIECCRHCGGEQRDYGGYKDKMNPKGVNLTDVWTDIPPVRHSKYKKRRANELSVKLLDRVVSMASDAGSVILDPFGGAGTTYAVAELLGRSWIGMELHASDILRRFKDLNPDREYLSDLLRRKNTLFTQSALQLRKRFGHKTDKYRVESPTESNGNGKDALHMDRTALKVA